MLEGIFMYLAIDVIMAMIEDEEWYEEEVDQSKITDPKTSSMTVFEILKINSEVGVNNDELLSTLENSNVEILSFTPDMIERVQNILNKYADLFDIGSLDSIHVAHSILLDEPIISTNQMYSYLEEIDHADPRKL